MDERERDLERFGEAVEQKKEEAKAASENAPHERHPGDGKVTDEGAQDQVSPRETGKGKTTADKWNQ